MNLLFANYGDFTANSLNHIGPFARALQALGHACAVAVPQGAETIAVIAQPCFQPRTFAELLAQPQGFPDGRGADLIHAWTPRENVRRFVLAYRRLVPARLIVHLEDNEEHLLSAILHCAVGQLRQPHGLGLADTAPLALSHPVRYRHFLRMADGVTVIVPTLRKFVPENVPCHELAPGVDFTLYRPQPAEPELRAALGLRVDEKVIVFTGSNTFANEREVRDLYAAVALLNQQGVPTRLVRTGLFADQFSEPVPPAWLAPVVNLGFVEKARLPRLLALADVLVQPGRPGDFNDYRLPSKLPEMLSVGRPVVAPATNVGRELRDGEEALLLHQGSPEEMAAACRRIFADAPLAERLSAQAVRFARRHYDLATNTAGLLAFYGERLAPSPAPGDRETAWSTKQSELTPVLRAMGLGGAEAEETLDYLEHLALLAEDIGALRQAGAAGELHRQRAELAEKQVGQQQHRLELTEQHVRNLENLLEPTRQQLKLTAQHAANLEGMLGATRQQQELTAQHAANLEALLVQLRQERQLTADHVHNLEAAAVQLTAAHEKVATERQQLQQELASLRQSRSWRWTAPLRWLSRVGRRAR